MKREKVVTIGFCEPFIERLVDYAQEYFLKEGKDLSRLAIVFGGKRPALFMKRELAGRIKRSFLSPKFFTIEELIDYIVEKKESFGNMGDLDTCYGLYQLTREVAPRILQGRESFARFLPWTREIAAFIDQLDLEQVADEKLKNIQDNAEIGYDVPEDINQLLQSIVVLRGAYHKKLGKDRFYSRGYRYLRASEVIGDVTFPEFDQILFCNFFYFNRSEEKIVRDLYARDLATLIFQGDQRKWPILERIATRFNCEIKEGEEIDRPEFDLKLYAGYDAHSQVCQVREILKHIKNKGRTVIVLPNADHIIPLLSEIARIVDDFNISMGYPLKRSSLYTLFEFVFNAQLSRKEDRYYTRDYLKLLRHPFIKNLRVVDSAAATRILVHKIEEVLTGKVTTSLSGSLFLKLPEIQDSDEIYMLTKEMCGRLGIKISTDELRLILETIHRIFFLSWEDMNNFDGFSEALGSILDILIDKSFLRNYPLNLNIANKMYEIKEEFQRASFKKERFEQEEIFRIFDGKISMEMMAFIGSPLKGLQILGLFETRSLNFENVIILDVNEGALPRLSIYEPLIPREVMISLNLDRLELEEEIQRYQFMRLISSAKEVHLVYQQSKDKERSRFIEELIWERQKQDFEKGAMGMSEMDVAQARFEVKVQPKELLVKKTPAMIEFLKQHTYSASSINMYLRNPMDFYYSYVLGLKENEDLLDEPEARHIGTFIHELLEEVYKPFLLKKPVIDLRFQQRVLGKFEERFNDTFLKSMKADSFLLKAVLLERLKRFLENEQRNPDRQVEELLHLEQRFCETIPLSRGEIKFSYVVDRVDRMIDGTVMIVDYKTGSLDQMPVGMDRIEAASLSRTSIFENVRSFQVPLYFHYLNTHFKGVVVNAALYNLRTLEFKKFIDPKASCDRQQMDHLLMTALDFVVSEILDPEVDFVFDDSHQR